MRRIRLGLWPSSEDPKLGFRVPENGTGYTTSATQAAEPDVEPEVHPKHAHTTPPKQQHEQ